MHAIQRKILLKLLYADQLGYAQMRPEKIESNHYAYHLDQLVKAGLVKKQDKKYALAPAGMALVDRMSQEKMVERIQPHICTAIDLTTATGQSLAYQRTFQPFINRIGFVKGKAHYEETLQEAAIRELQEKSGITGITLTHRGIVYLTATQDEVVISKAMYHLFTGTIAAPVATPATYRGHCLWIKPETYKATDLMPGYLEMKQLLQDNPHEFFAELTGTL